MWRLVAHLNHGRETEKGLDQPGGSLCLALTLGSCRTLPLTSADKKSDRPVVDSGVVQSLQQQIREREKRIAELESQLDALR